MLQKRHLIFLFIDGIGIGEAKGHNPFYQAKTGFLPLFPPLPSHSNGVTVKAIDPLLGVAGMPQSATGQTTLFSGINVPERIGAHRGSFPNRELRRILGENNLLQSLKEKGVRARYINAFPVYNHLFNESHVRILPDGRFWFSDSFPRIFRRRISVTTAMMLLARQQPGGEKEILNGEALFQDFSNRSLTKRGLTMPGYSPEKAGRILAKISKEFDFILYEFFLTDLYGHRKAFSQQLALIKRLDRLLNRLFKELDPLHDTVLITSDHGNLEDSRHDKHTLNPVPLITWGVSGDYFQGAIDTIQDVTPAILAYFS